MKFVIDKAVFLKALQRVQGIVEKRNTMPILSNVALEAKDGGLTLIATDLEVFIKDSVKASVSQEGAVTVSARKLFEIVKELQDEKVDFSANKESKVTIKGGKAKFNIMGLGAADYPAFPSIEITHFKTIDKDILKEMIDKTSFAVSTDETRYNINGFLFETEGPTLRLVTTDGHRLALIEKKDEKSFGASGKDGKTAVLLPRKGVMEFRKLLDEAGGENAQAISLAMTQKNAVMKNGDTVINIRLLEGEFPDYKKVIPKDNDRTAVAGKEELLSSLKRVSILSTDKIKGVKFKFAKKKLELSCSSPDVGDATEEIDIEYDGDEIETAFNARYIIDMMESVEDQRIKIELKDHLNPGVLRPEAQSGYTYVIMPMRL